MTIILDKESDQGWVKDYSTSGVTHITGIAFIQMWSAQPDNYERYELSDWENMEGETFTFEDEETRGKIYDIHVSDGIPASVFSPDTI